MNKIKKQLIKQGHRFVGSHSCVKICRWTKKSLIDDGVCYKEKFYGIESHRCCQMSPFLGCQNMCLHCWRPIEINFKDVIKNKIDNPFEIIDGCIREQRKLLTGFKGNLKVNEKKFKEAQEPMNFAISLIGEPLMHPRIGEIIKELRKRGKTSFLVSNGLCPKVLRKLESDNNLPTQLYISVNAPNKKIYDEWHQSSVKNAWEEFNKSLEIMLKLKGKTRRVLRMTLVKELNMNDEMIEEYAKIIEKAQPDFVEVKGFVSVGFSRKRLGYDMMPRHDLVRSYSEKIVEELKKINLKNYKILDEHEASSVVLIGSKKVLN